MLFFGEGDFNTNDFLVDVYPLNYVLLVNKSAFYDDNPVSIPVAVGGRDQVLFPSKDS